MVANEKLRDKLWPLKLSYGDFQYVLKDPNIYNTLQVIAAHGPLEGIYGWAGIYNRNGNIFIGIFVESKYRHQGLGAKLKEQAIEVCKAQGIPYIWQDRKSNDEWVKVDINGVEQRLPHDYFD